MILDDEDGFSTDFYGTDLDEALRIKRTKTFTDYSFDFSLDSEDDSTRIQLFLSLIEESLEENYSGNYKVYYEDEVINVDMWIPGTAVCITLAKEGDDDALSAWETLKESMAVYSQSLEVSKEKMGIPNVSILVTVLNDTNLDKGVLVFHNGECILDVVTD